jgi:multidrug efflux pump subunit AcrA (membrane-fusion protein)
VVYRLQGEHFQAVPVELGATTPGRVVISSGLDAGDQIALADPSVREGEGSGGAGAARPLLDGKAAPPR